MTVYVYGALALAVFLGYRLTSRRQLLPPGPRGLPLVGNAFEFPSSSIWETFTRWKASYGELTRSHTAALKIRIINVLHVNR